MGTTIYQVDAFTSKPFSGNPAGVCILPVHGDDHWMQQVAREMNLSETAFLSPEVGGYHLRWFTPAVEVDLCGHATLASAHILWETGQLAPDQEAHFQTASGPLKAYKEEGWIWMDFPALPPTAMTPPEGLAEALGIKPTYVGQNRLDLLAVVDTASDVRELHPDIARLRSVDTGGSSSRPLRTSRNMILSPAPSSLPSGLTRTPSPARLTAAWGPTGASVWEKWSCWVTRPRRGAGW